MKKFSFQAKRNSIMIMKHIHTPFPLVKLPADVQITLHLIREELKSRKFFYVLQEAGLDDCYFQPHLDSIILNSIDMDDGTDETFSLYDDIIDRRSKKIDASNDSIMKQALKVYAELMALKKKVRKGRQMK
jgi:hypothetical protein